MSSKAVEGGRGYLVASAGILQSSRSSGILYHYLHNTVLGINAECAVTMNPSCLNHRITEVARDPRLLNENGLVGQQRDPSTGYAHRRVIALDNPLRDHAGTLLAAQFQYLAQRLALLAATAAFI
jgi:hypothetical protein